RQAFFPTRASDNAFNTAVRAKSWLAACLIPVWIIMEQLQIRGNAHLFQPIRRILPDGYGACYGSYFAKRFVYCELSAAYTLPFATLSVYGSYGSYPARNWNCGISFGLYFLAPQFLR
ncbi:MAG: patatin, partial [Muribaculaceae bacterium]|nr:patatin [Muribaculaceae bacterium]